MSSSRVMPKLDDQGDRLMTPTEVAHLFRVDPKTVTRWAAAGRIGSIRTPGGHRRFRESEVQRLLDAGTPILEGTFEYGHGVVSDAEVIAHVKNTTKASYTGDFTPGEPFVSEAFGPKPGYVVGECAHAVAQSEWNAGFRKCERC